MAGRYSIIEELGASGVGGMVYKAYDSQLNRYIAVKHLMTREEAESGDAHSQKLVAEAGELAMLQHPNIVSIYDFSNDEEGFFIVMELLEGESLRDVLMRGPLNLMDTYELASQILEALVTAHQHNVLHRDLKPANIKVQRSPSGRLLVKVLDFGMARLSYQAKVMEEEQGTVLMGTAYYLAPEQFQGTAEDGRTDLYGLGCILFEALSGRRAFDGQDADTIIQMHLQHQVHLLQSVAPTVPSAISDWVMWHINTDPSNRPVSAQQSLDALRAIHASGWFNPATKRSQPVVVGLPAVTAAGLGPITQGLSRVQGSSTQALSGKPRRPTAAVPKAPASATAAAPAKKKAKDEDEDPENKIPRWIWPASAAVVLLLVIGFWPKGSESDAQDAKNAIPLGLSTTDRPQGLATREALWHFVAGQGLDRFTFPGATVKPLQVGDPVQAWRNLSGNGGGSALFAWQGQREHCPTYVHDTPPSLRRTAALLRFTRGQAMNHVLQAPEKASNLPLADLKPPGAEPSVLKKGVSLAVVARAIPDPKEVAFVRLTNKDQSVSLTIRAFPNNQFVLLINIAGKSKEARVSGLDTKAFSVLTATWDPVKNKAVLSVTSATGGRSRVQIDSPPLPDGALPLTEVRVSEGPTPGKSPPEPHLFVGDIAELLVWPGSMDEGVQNDQERSLATFYFNLPGSRS